MRRPTRALALALAPTALLSACAGDPAEGEAGATGAATPSSSAVASPSGGSPSEGSSAVGGTVLTGTVGTPDDPDAYEIALTDADGQPVESLPAGDYTLEVDDPSDIHNFRLEGDGVDEATTVPEVTTATFEVTLTAGEYTYLCDPHPAMVGTFTVT